MITLLTRFPLISGINLDQTYRYANQETLQSGIVPLPLHFQQEQSLRKETCQRSLARDVLERADILIQIIKYKLLVEKNYCNGLIFSGVGNGDLRSLNPTNKIEQDSDLIFISQVRI